MVATEETRKECERFSVKKLDRQTKMEREREGKGIERGGGSALVLSVDIYLYQLTGC